MAITATDVISDDMVGAILEERTLAMNQFRRAFRAHDATGLEGSSVTFPVPGESLEDDMSEVGEEGNYPRSALSHEGIQASYTKEGFEVAISDEAVDDTPVDVLLDVTEQMAVAAETRLDALAFEVLDNNQNATTVGTSGEPVNYEAIVDSFTTLAGDRFNPANFEYYFSTSAWGSLAKDDSFNRATDEGDALARQGMLGEVFGRPVIMSNTGDLGATEGFLVDTSIYGYESTRWNREVESYREETNDRDIFKIRHRKDFVATNPDAALFIEGGVVA